MPQKPLLRKGFSRFILQLFQSCRQNSWQDIGRAVATLGERFLGGLLSTHKTGCAHPGGHGFGPVLGFVSNFEHCPTPGRVRPFRQLEKVPTLDGLLSVVIDAVGDGYAHAVVRRNGWTMVVTLDGSFEHVVLDFTHENRAIGKPLPDPPIPRYHRVHGSIRECFYCRSFRRLSRKQSVTTTKRKLRG